MRRLVFLFLTFFVFFTAKSQYPITQNLGSDSTLIRLGSNYGGAIKGNVVLRGYYDTTAANLVRIAQYAGALIYTTSDSKVWKRNSTNTKWDSFATSAELSYVTGCYGLLNGGVVTWSGTGLVMNVTAAYYVINCNYYNADGSLSVTLSTADPTNPRIDVIAVDTSENIVVITGTPGVNPVKPQVNPTYQVELTEVYVPAGATTPNEYTYKTVYNENVEWTSGSTLSSGTVNFNSTVFPSVGTKNLRVASGTIGNVYWDTTGAFLTSNYQSLSLRFSLASSPTNDMLPYIYLRDNGVQVTYSLALDGFGYSSVSGINEYNVVTVPMSAFTFTSGSTFDGIGLYFGGIGAIVDVDYVQLQTGTNGGGVIGNYLEGIRRLPGSTDVEGLKNGVWQYLFTDSTGSGGSSYIFSEGLTESGGTVKLGGTISESRQILGTGGGSLYIDSLIYFIAGAKTWPDRTALLSYSNNAAIQYRNQNNIHNEIGLTTSLSYIRSGLATTDYSFFKTQRTDSSARIMSISKKVFIDSINTVSSTTGRKVLVHDTATGKIERIDPSNLELNYADSLRRSGLTVQMRKAGVWTNQFHLPDSSGGGSSSSSTYIEKLKKTVQITEQGSYTAFAFSYVYLDSLHIVASQGTGSHIDKFNVVDYVSGDGGRTYIKRTILTHADTSYRDCGGGVDSAGRVWLFASKYTYTSPNNYSGDPIINVYRYNNGTYSLFQANLSRNGNAYAVAYGKIIYFGDTAIQTAYGGNAAKVFTYQSIAGGEWTVRSNLYTGVDQTNETCLERISNNTVVAIGRTSGQPPKMFISHDCGNTWINSGNVYGGVTNNVSPWLQKVNDTTLVYVYGDRNIGGMFIRGEKYKVSYLDTAIATTASQAANFGRLNLCESVLNNRANTSGAGGHFGYPSISYLAGQFVIVYNDLYQLQPSPYGGDDDVTVSLFVKPLMQKVYAKLYNSGQLSFPPNVATRVTFNQSYTDTHGIIDGNNNIVIPEAGLYEVKYSTSLSTSQAGRRVVYIYRVNGTDTASTTSRLVIAQKDFPTIAGYAGYNHNIYVSERCYLNQGDVIKFYIAPYGASGNVVYDFTQNAGGYENGVFSNLCEVLKIDDE